MSEKRFKVVQDPRVQTEYFIYDNENKISSNITDYPFNNEDVCSRIVMLLNELAEENEYLRESYEICKKFLSEAIEENELLECKEGVYNVHRLKKDYEQLKEENKKLKHINDQLEERLESSGIGVALKMDR